jgi:RNA polymerase sigma factor (sigma-70 family)
MNLNQYLERRLTYLRTIASKITNNRNISDDLVNDAAIVILTKSNFKGEINDMAMDKYFCGIMTWIHQNNLLKRKKMTYIEEGFNLEGSTEIVYHETQKTFYEWELIESGYTEEQANKLSNIKFNLKKLKPYERNLYKMYFEQGLSLRKIARKVKLHHSTIFIHLRDLKSKLGEFSKYGGIQY